MSKSFLDSRAAMVGVGVLAVAVVGYFVAKKIGGAAGAAAKAVGTAINPTSDQNLAYRAVTGIGAAVTGSDSWSLGSWLYDVTHPNDGKELTATTPPFVQDAQRLRDGAANTNSLWGPLGSVDLRTN